MGLNIFSLQRVLSDQDPQWCVREVARDGSAVLVDIETSYPLDIDITCKLENTVRSRNGSRLQFTFRYFCVDAGTRWPYEPLRQLDIA